MGRILGLAAYAGSLQALVTSGEALLPPLTSLRTAKRHGARAVHTQTENGLSRWRDSLEP